MALAGQWDAAIYLLQTPLISHNTEQFIHHDEKWIDFPGMLDTSRWSGAERLLILVAYDLYNGMGNAPVGELVGTLDDEHFERFIEAMRIRRRLGRTERTMRRADTVAARAATSRASTRIRLFPAPDGDVLGAVSDAAVGPRRPC
jgi:hypothetical protein